MGFQEESSKSIFWSSQIAQKLQSIDHFIYLYATEGKYFLPPRCLITWEFIRKVITGDKLLFKFNKISPQNYLPRAKGLSVNNLFEEMRNDTDFLRYFPDIPKGTSVPRDYFMTVS
jgi:hypothetical protein